MPRHPLNNSKVGVGQQVGFAAGLTFYVCCSCRTSPLCWRPFDRSPLSLSEALRQPSLREKERGGVSERTAREGIKRVDERERENSVKKRGERDKKDGRENENNEQKRAGQNEKKEKKGS